MECSLSARLLLIGLLNVADDEGNLERSPVQIKAKIFPCDNIKVEPLVGELLSHGLIVEYGSDSKKYLHIKGFAKHQVINRKSKPRCPLYDESLNTHGVVREDSHQEGKGREGNGKDKEHVGAAPNGALLASPIVLTLPLRDGSEFGVNQSLVSELEPLYPAVDVPQTLREMKGWLVGNPERRKTRSGARKFITSWLQREQDKHGR